MRLSCGCHEPYSKTSSIQITGIFSINKMEINLQAIAGTNLPKPQREIFDTFTTSLYSKGNSQAHAKTIADAIHRLCHATESEDHVGNILWNLWSVLIDIVQRIPPDHPWQETLVRALDNLRHRNGVVIRLNQV
jgi:hypothetical protein